MRMKNFPKLKRARFQNRGESECIRLNVMVKHLSVESKCLLVEAMEGVGVNNGSPQKDVRILGLGEKGNGVIESAMRGVRAL